MRFFYTADVIIFLMLGLYACGSPIGSPSPVLPMYPNAQDVQQSISDHVQEISFHTADTPAEVLSYYVDTLVQQKWTLVGRFPEARTFVYLADSNPGYDLDVVIMDVRDGQTYVQMRLRGVGLKAL